MAISNRQHHQLPGARAGRAAKARRHQRAGSSLRIASSNNASRAVLAAVPMVLGPKYAAVYLWLALSDFNVTVGRAAQFHRIVWWTRERS